MLESTPSNCVRLIRQSAREMHFLTYPEPCPDPYPASARNLQELENPMKCSPSKARPIAIVLAAMSLLAGTARADITLISFGGTNQKAQAKAFYEPY